MIRQIDMAESIPAQEGGLAGVNHLAEHAPVDGDQLPRLELLNIEFGLQIALEGFKAGFSQIDLSFGGQKRFYPCRHSRPLDLGDRSPADAAGIHAFQRMLSFLMPGSFPDIQNVKRMVRDGSLLNLFGQPVEVPAAKPVFQPQTLPQVTVELLLGDVFQQLVADPVGLYYPLIKWIFDFVGMGDVKQVGVHRLERSQQAAQVGVSRFFLDVGEDLPISIRSAIVQAIGAEGIAAAANHSIHHLDIDNIS